MFKMRKLDCILLACSGNKVSVRFSRYLFEPYNHRQSQTRLTLYVTNGGDGLSREQATVADAALMRSGCPFAGGILT